MCRRNKNRAPLALCVWCPQYVETTLTNENGGYLGLTHYDLCHAKGLKENDHFYDFMLLSIDFIKDVFVLTYQYGDTRRFAITCHHKSAIDALYTNADGRSRHFDREFSTFSSVTVSKNTI